MFFIKILKKLIKALGSESSPNQLALGFAFGMILGFTPFWSIHNIVLIFIIALIRINISSVLLGTLVFGLLAPLFDNTFHSLGLAVLQYESLQGLWQLLYANTFFILTRFNNTIVLGSLLTSIVLFIPAFFGFKVFAKFYKETIHPKVEKWKITKMLKGSKIFNLLNTGYQLKK